MNITQKQLNNFWKKVDKTDTCWLWKAGQCGDGYGDFRVDKKMMRAHIFSALIHNLPNPDNKPCVLHSCDVRNCVRPSHLRWGTKLENSQDREVRNPDSHAKGEKQGLSKLTEKQILEIRAKYIPYKYSTIKLAKEYNIGKSNVYYIINNNTWKHI